MTDTIVLGLDGATWDVLDPLRESGSLPNIDSLVEQGYDGTLESTFPPITAPAWLSMATGQNPGKTGVFYFLNRDDPDSFEFEPLGSDEFRGRSFWDVLSANGRSVGVFNFPMLYPPYPINGFMVSGLGSPEDDTITYPDELQGELDDVTDGYRIKVPYADPKYKDRPEALATDLREVISKRERAIEYLLTEKDPDVFFGVISATDWAQHYFWRHYDESHALFDPEHPMSGEGTLEALWERVDEAVGTVKTLAEREDARLVLVSDHGFGPVNRTFHSNEWLEREGFRVSAEQSAVKKLRTKYFPYLRKVGELLVDAVPQLNDVAKSVGKTVRGSPGDTVDWERSVAFAPKQNLTCGMLYMLSDDPNDRDAVIEGLRSLTDKSGEPLDVNVYRPEDLYHGPEIDLAPDVLFEIHDFECAVDPRHATTDGVFSNGPPSVARSGGHRTEGIYVLAGSDIEPGTGGDASLLDVAPTLLFATNTPIPSEMDGNVLAEPFTDEANDDRTIERAPLSTLVRSDAQDRRGDADDVQKRLEDLGYI